MTAPTNKLFVGAMMTDEQIDTLRLAIGYIGSSERKDRHEHVERIRALLSASKPAVAQGQTDWDRSQGYAATTDWREPTPAVPAQSGEPVAYTTAGRLKRIAERNRHVDTMWPASMCDEGDIPLYTHHPAEAEQALTDDPIARLIAQHAEMLEGNPYAYFELACTRYTGWMAWLCSNSRDDDPSRKVLARGQGSTAQEACEAALTAAQPASEVDRG